MTDDQWLSAMRKHSRDHTDWVTFTGGALEQSHVLHSMTTADPVRFARLALRMDTGTHPAYGAPLLRGLGDAQTQDDAEAVFAAVRHLAGAGKPEHDRWLGWSLRKYLGCVPLDLLQTLLHRALGADPGQVADDEEDKEGEEDEVDAERDLLTAGIPAAAPGVLRGG
ncbi:hypothetical protein [Kitasatospora sp. NPDC091207]|uniref:hypothetical protein n=1 Tax=Kitasatospora sp. NPDC091207 TaxID=3364083 RepID=UPI0037FCFB09